MKDYLFSKALIDRMSKLDNVEFNEAIKDPNFFNELMAHAGMDLNQIKEMWKKVGRPDIAELTEYEEE